MKCPVPPPVPSLEIMYKMMSFEHTPSFRVPFTLIRMVLGLDCNTHWEASTISTSLVPIPKAIHPIAPWVEVWLSPQTIVIPGWVSPVSGPITWIIPFRAVPTLKMVIPFSAQFFSSVASCLADSGSLTGRCWSWVGMLWSGLAVTCAGRNTFAPRERSPSNACGLVTSWIYCLSIYKTHEPPAMVSTVCASQILSNNVFFMV